MARTGARLRAALAVAGAMLASSAGTATAEPDSTPNERATDAEVTDAVGDREQQATHIVVLDDDDVDVRSSAAADVQTEVMEHAGDHAVEPTQVYSHALAGYAARLTDVEVAALETDPTVAYVDEVTYLELQQADDQVVPTGVQRVFGPDNPNTGIGGPDDERVDADIAVIDGGVAYHPDLNVAARVECVYVPAGSGCVPGGEDENGHGTQVAGAAAAVNDTTGVVGVAPGARIWSHRVCNSASRCPNTAILAAIDHVTANADIIEVANMSVGGPDGGHPDQDAVKDAITASIDAGVVYTVAAGNSDVDAATFTPANHPDVVTVSALADSDGLPGGLGGPPECRTSSHDDYLADFSNWGSVVDVTAPGVCITSTTPGGGYEVVNGTSFAAPHVAGAAALLTSGGAAPTDRDGVLAIRDQLADAGNLDWTWAGRGPGDVQEPLLDVGDPTVFDPARHVPATASFDVSCHDATLTCEFDASASSHPSETVSEWSWRFGDGTTGSGETVTHTYDRAAAYEVSLMVTAGDATGTTAEPGLVVGDPAWKPAERVPGGVARTPEAQCADDPDGYYEFGGLIPGGGWGLDWTNEAYRYDGSTDSWSELAPYPGTISFEQSATVCTDDGKIHILGEDSGGPIHYVYDTATDSYETAAPPPPAGSIPHSAAGYWQGHIYLVGGESGTSSTAVSIYDVASDTWSDGPTLPLPLWHSGDAQVGQYLYLAGGSTGDRDLEAALRLDMATDTWLLGPSMTEARSELTLVATDTALYAVGGQVDVGGGDPAATDTVERLPLDEWTSGEWTELDPLERPTSMLGGACVPSTDGARVGAVGGGRDTLDLYREFWLMTVPDEQCAHTVDPG